MTKEEFVKSLDCNVEDLDIVKLVEKKVNINYCMKIM